MEDTDAVFDATFMDANGNGILSGWYVNDCTTGDYLDVKNDNGNMVLTMTKGETAVYSDYDMASASSIVMSVEEGKEYAISMQVKGTGMKYGTSLCHAWGSGPIYLLGKYCCGVSATGVGYRTFEVRPNFGNYKEVHAVVPIKDGTVEIIFENGELEIMATVPGGTLVYEGRSFELPVNQKVRG